MTTDTAASSLWRNRRYLVWLVSDTSKALASSLANFAVPLIALIATNDPAQAGVIAAVALVVRLVLTLYGGVLADRHHRITLMMLGSLLGVVIGVAFTVLALAQALTFVSLLVIAVLLAARSGLFDVAGEAAIKEIVPDDQMGRAQAANQGREAAIQLAGGPLGGFLLGIGAWLVGAAVTAFQLLAVLTAWLLGRSERRATPADPAPDAAASRPGNALGEIREGFSWLLSRPDLGGVMAAITVINLGFNTVMTTVVYGVQQAGHSELTIGWMSAGFGAVMLLGALVAPALVPRVGAGVLTILGFATTTLGAIVVSHIESPWGIVLVIGAAVFLLPALNAALLGYFMVATPTELLGRANSATAVFSMGAMPLAPLIAGFGLSWMGRTNTVLLGAAICGAALALGLSNRALRDLPAEARWAEHARQYEP